MPEIYIILFAAVIGLHIFIYIKRKQNLKTLQAQLDSSSQSGSLFWGGTIKGRYQGREVMCYSHTKATQIFMSASADQKQELSTKSIMFALPALWPRVSDDCNFKDGKLFYSGLGMYGMSFYYKNISPSDFKNILNKMVKASEMVQRDGGHNYSNLDQKNFNYRILLFPIAAFAIGIIAYLQSVK